jgi:hypothetical protein
LESIIVEVALPVPMDSQTWLMIMLLGALSQARSGTLCRRRLSLVLHSVDRVCMKMDALSGERLSSRGDAGTGKQALVVAI